MKKTKLIATTLCATIISLSFACGSGDVKDSKDDNSKMELKKENDWEVQKVNKAESAEMSQVIANYLEVKDALTKDDVEEASTSSEKFHASVELLDGSLYKDGDAEKISNIRNDMMEKSDLMIKSGLKEQRQLLEDVTKQMQDLIGLIGTDRDLYLQYCPMYNQNKGGYWLSEKTDIINPLFGSSMLKCGVVKKEFAI